MTGTFVFQKTDLRPMPDFNVFFKYYASYPHYSDCIWSLTQMRLWGQITETKPAAWFVNTANEVYKPEINCQAAMMLVSVFGRRLPKVDRATLAAVIANPNRLQQAT